MRDVEFDETLFERIQSAVQPGDEIQTLTTKRPNVIAGIERDGIWVRTSRSDSLGSGPQLVPAWMIVKAWDRLRREHVLSHTELLEDLNVKRSAFVMALLAQFPDVIVSSANPIVIELLSSS